MNKILSQITEKYLNAVKNLIPQQQDKPLLGLDLGLHSCQMVEMKKKGSSYELVNWGIEPNLSGDYKTSIKKLLAQLTFPNNSPATAISGKGCLIRFIELPKMSPEDLKRSFAYEADKYFPFPRDQIYNDFYVVDEAVKDNKMWVMVAAVKKDLVDERIRLLNDIGLQADFISLNSIAIANAVSVLGSKGTEKNAENKEKNEAIAVLDLDEMVSSVTVLLNQRPQFNRDIFIGGRDFTKSISNNMQVSMEEAERLQEEPGNKAPAILQACDSAVLDLVSELRLSFDYFATDKNLPLSQVLLTGTVSGLGGLAEVLEKYLEMTVRPWNPLDYLSLASQVSSSDVRKYAKKLTVAAALALYG